MAAQLPLEPCQTSIQRSCAVVTCELSHPQQPLVQVTLSRSHLHWLCSVQKLL